MTYQVCKKLIVWDSVNYSEFEADWTYEANWNATYFEDLFGAWNTLRQVWTWVSLNSTENSIDYLNTANLSDYSYGNMQTRHAWKIGSVVYPHIHWKQGSNSTPNWLFQYRRQINWQAIDTTWKNLKFSDNVLAYTSWTINQISWINAWLIPPVWSWLSNTIEFRMIRDTTNASWLFAWSDPYTGTVRATFIDIHLEENTLWSRQQYVK